MRCLDEIFFLMHRLPTIICVELSEPGSFLVCFIFSFRIKEKEDKEK